jgi:hypothetical protein
MSVELFSNADLADMAACNEFPRRLFASSSNIRNERTFFDASGEVRGKRPGRESFDSGRIAEGMGAPHPPPDGAMDR